ncbi:MAG: hypothetical protein ACYCQI_14475, partial [Gammaproteobacteria bacterium]
SLSNEIITCGFVFDPAILERAAKRFEENVNKCFGGWWSLQTDVFWVNGFGKLQGRLSSRDAQVVCAGIGRFVDDGRMPPRSFNNSDGTFNFLDPRSRLGLDFFLGYYGNAVHGLRGGFERVWVGRTGGVYNSYVEQKQQQQHYKVYAMSGKFRA